MSGGKKKKQEQKPEEANEEERKGKVLSDINYESTLFGVWVTNFWYVVCFLFVSFVIMRTWSTEV